MSRIHLWPTRPERGVIQVEASQSESNKMLAMLAMDHYNNKKDWQVHNVQLPRERKQVKIINADAFIIILQFESGFSVKDTKQLTHLAQLSPF